MCGEAVLIVEVEVVDGRWAESGEGGGDSTPRLPWQLTLTALGTCELLRIGTYLNIPHTLQSLLVLSYLGRLTIGSMNMG